MQYSIVNLKTIQRNNDSFRYDAEYFQREFLELEDLLEKKRSASLCDLVKKIDVGHVGLMVSEYYDKGVLLLQTQNVQEFFLNLDNCKRINALFHAKLKKSQIHYGDILIARSGSFGNASIYLEKDTINSADIIIVESDPNKINVFYLCAFLNSEIGKNQMYRFASGGLQGHVNLTILENLKIPIFSTSFQQSVEKIVKDAYLLKNKNENLYSQAEQILLSELGLINWKPKHRLSFVKNFSDTQANERIDAEYFQPMYEEVIKAIKSSKNYACLGDIVLINKCIEPGSEAYQDGGIPFLRVSNLSKFGINTDNQRFLSETLYDNLKSHQPKKGEILLSKDATPGIAYYLKDTPSKMIPSGGILRVTVKDANRVFPEYLTLVLNSSIVQKQIERDAGGSIINHWLVDQVKNTLIPILPVARQKKIAETINDSFYNRELSKNLLNIAKRGVELAIEKDEKHAQKWIDLELKREKQF